jgi:hypothetical protein
MGRCGMRVRACLLVAVSAACAVDRVPATTSETGDGDGDGESETVGDGDGDPGDGDGDGDPGDGDGDPEACACAPGTDLIYIASQFGEIHTYDPTTDSFAEVGQTTCGSGMVYSMAVDHDNHGWIVDLETRDLVRIDLANPQSCTEPPWVPGNQGFIYPSIGFVSNDTVDVCETLYLINFSGEGPFAEGPGIGKLGIYDPADGSVSVLADIDYDGGELKGTGDGRLFAFAGTNPAKLIQYDPETGAVLDLIPLDTLEKTSASAFAFHSGDFYFFTEGTPPDCLSCLDACTPLYQECLADPACAESFACALSTGRLTDDCGGLMPQALADCMTNTCLDECFPIGGKRSVVTRLDFDESGGNGKLLEVVNPEAPIRVVGAGTSICAPLSVP